MKRLRPAAILLTIFSLLAVRSSPACTTVAFKAPSGDLMIAKNLDWQYVHGFAAINPRGLNKAALLLPDPNAKPVSWKAQFGSLTLNQVSRNFPFGGMNEAGLMIEVMWLSETQHPPLRAGTPSINEAQYMQFILDQAASVPAAIELTKGIQIQRSASPIHYMLCDKQNACAIVEFVQGKRHIFTADSLPYKALTNNNYGDSIAFLHKHVGFGGRESLPAGDGSLERFVRAVSESERHVDPVNNKSLDRGFSILEKVMTATAQWQIVYDPSSLRLGFRTRDSLKVKTVSLDKIDFKCQAGYRFHSMNQKNDSGEITDSFIPLTNKVSEEHIQKSGFLPQQIKTLLVNFERSTPLQCN